MKGFFVGLTGEEGVVMAGRASGGLEGGEREKSAGGWGVIRKGNLSLRGSRGENCSEGNRTKQRESRGKRKRERTTRHGWSRQSIG